MNTIEHCSGCENNFYNGNNPYGVARCWSLKTAKMITRFQLGINTPMHIREAYVRVKKPSCFHRKGYVFLSTIPSYAQTRKERDEEKQREESKPRPACDHDYLWILRSGEIWGTPENLASYDRNLICGECKKCGHIHEPKIEALKKVKENFDAAIQGDAPTP